MKYGMKNILFSLFVFPLACPVAAQTAQIDRRLTIPLLCGRSSLPSSLSLHTRHSISFFRMR